MDVIFYYLCNVQNINFHIAYLLTKHECVIIPGFGAFLSLSCQASKDEYSSLWAAPGKTLCFNPQICHNDGLLANSISREKKISFAQATRVIKDYVEHLERGLISNKGMHIPWVGDLTRSDKNKIDFTPDKQLSCNLNYYGLNNLYLSPLAIGKEEGIQETTTTEIVRPSFRETNKWARIITASAAAAVLFLIAIPANDYPNQNNTQHASLISLPKATSIEAAESSPTSETKGEEIASFVEETVVIDVNTRFYYIVISSLPTLKHAEKKLEEFQNTTFPEAAIISKGDKHRIYINRFEDKTEAESFLAEFRINHPQYAKAWLLAQRG